WDARVEHQPNLASVALYPGLPRLYFAHDAVTLEDEGHWYRNFIYRVERERGLDYKEDLFSPFALHFSFDGKKEASLIASTQARDVRQATACLAQEPWRRAAIVARAPVQDEFVEAVAVAADQFVVRRERGYTVLAGYPWFTDWGRDTMIALSGLTLFTGRSDVAKGILL